MTVLHRLLLTVFFLIAVSPVFAAGPSEHVRAIVSGIVTYTRWPSLTGAPKLCIFASSRFTHSLAHEDPDALPYQPVIVRNSEEALKTTCDGFLFWQRIADPTVGINSPLWLEAAVTHRRTKYGLLNW